MPGPTFEEEGKESECGLGSYSWRVHAPKDVAENVRPQISG